MKMMVPTVSQKQIAAYLESTAPGVDIRTCLIDAEHNLIPTEVWLWDGTAGEHHPATEEGLALLFPNINDRNRFVTRLVRVVLDDEVVTDFCDDLIGFLQAA